nr:hypothetical protein [Endozoicomonas sp.]
MMRIEKYTLRNGQAGWQAHLVKLNCSKIHETCRFSSSEYGDLAFQKAVDWLESKYYQAAENIMGQECSTVVVTDAVLDAAWFLSVDSFSSGSKGPAGGQLF